MRFFPPYPIPKHVSQRVGVLVDIQNMYHSAKHLYGGRVNFRNLLKAAVGERQLVRAVAYVVKSQSMEEENFFDALVKLGFEVKSKDLQVYAGGAKKGDWDVGITIDAVKMGEKMDAIVLVTGDGDFVPLVVYLQENKGCVVEVMAFESSASSRLIEASDHFIDLGLDPKQYLIGMNGRERFAGEHL